MMQDELVTRKVAELARERGFNEKVDRFYPLNDDKGEDIFTKRKNGKWVMEGHDTKDGVVLMLHYQHHYIDPHF